MVVAAHYRQSNERSRVSRLRNRYGLTPYQNHNLKSVNLARFIVEINSRDFDTLAYDLSRFAIEMYSNKSNIKIYDWKVDLLAIEMIKILVLSHLFQDRKHLSWMLTFLANLFPGFLVGKGAALDFMSVILM